MNDTVTITTSVANNQIVKSFGGAGYQPLKFSPGSEFLVSRQPVHDLHSLASVIGRLEGDQPKLLCVGYLYCQRMSLSLGNPRTFPKHPTTGAFLILIVCRRMEIRMIIKHCWTMPLPNFYQSFNRLIAGITSPPEWAMRLGSECICGIGWKGPALMLR